MSEKKVVSRSVAIALGIICIVLIAGFGGAMLYTVTLLNDKNNQIDSLKTQISGKDSQISQLNTQISALNSTISSLNSQISQLNAIISNLASIAILIEPASVEKLAILQTFTVNVTVENCVDIYALQVDIRYDPQVLNVTSISAGTFLSSTGPTYHSETAQLLNVTPPTARVFFAETKLGESLPDASGNGTLLTITFQVLSQGSTQIQFFSYPGGGVSVGTYFEKRDLTVVLPALHSGSYGL